MSKSQKIYPASYLIIYAVLLSLLAVLQIKPIVSFTYIYISASVVYILICRQILKMEVPANYIVVLLAISLVIKIIFIPLHPVGSDDYYRYIWDGKVQAHGINPYAYAPADTSLNSLHTGILPKLVNHPEMKTIYPPLTEILFYFSYIIGGDSFSGLKILMLISDLLTLFGLYLILKRQNIPYKNILIYALSPLIIFQLFIDAHADGFGLPFLIFSIFFYLDDQKLWSYVFLGLSLCIKPLGIIIIPIYFISEKNFFSRIKSAVIPLLICGLFYLPYTFNGSPFQSLIEFTENWTFNGIVFNILDFFIHNNQVSRIICSLLLLVTYLPVVFSKKNLLAKIYLSIFLLFIFSPVVHPWYVVWLALLLPVIPRWSGILYTSLISLTAFTVMNYQLTGVWKEYLIVQIFEYLPVILFFIYELFKFREDKSISKIA